MKSYGAAFWMYCLSVLDGRECCRYLRISKKVVNVIFIAVPIRAAFPIAIRFSKNLQYINFAIKLCMFRH